MRTSTLLLGACLACTNLQPITPATLSSSRAPARVWVTRADHAMISLDEPSISSDTIVGLHDGFLIRVAAADVVSVKANVVDPTRTAVLLIAIGALTAYATAQLAFKP